MRHTFLTAILPVVALVTLSGCFRLNMTEGDPVIATEDITVPADVEVGKVVASIPVTANQSWSAYIIGSCPWAEIVSEDHINPSGVSDESQVNIALENNDSDQPRSFKVCVTGSDCEKVVEVTQAAKVARLRVIGEQQIHIAAEPEKQELSLYSNTAWNVSVKEGGNIAASVEPASGYGDGTVSVTLDPNYSFRQDETVTLLFTGEGIDTVSVDYILAANEPFIRVDKVASRTEMIPVDTTASVVFQANDDWTAEIVSSDIEGLTLVQASGAEGQAELPIKLHRNPSDELHHAVIRIALASRPEVTQEINLTQRRGICFFIDFSTSKHGLEPATENDTPIKAGAAYHVTDGIEHGYLYTLDGVQYLFGVWSNPGADGYYWLSKGAFYISIGYVKFPAIENRKLVELRLCAANSSKEYAVCEDAAGKTPTEGGIKSSSTAGGTIKWVLTNTAPNTSYYVYSGNKGCQISSFTIIYE